MSKPFVLHAALLTLLLAACRPDATGSGTAVAASSQAQPPSWRVVLLGDESRKNVLRECVARNVCPAGSETAFVLPPPQATAAQTADTAQQADVPALAVLFTQSDALDDKDLLELEIMEIRDLLNSYEMDGEHARIYVGDQGLQQLLADAAALAPRPQPSAPLADSRSLHGYIYNLSRAEGGHALSAGDSMDIWIGGQTVRCKLVSPQSVADGETPEVRLETEKPLAAAAGQRFLLQQNGRLIAAGVVEDAE